MPARLWVAAFVFAAAASPAPRIETLRSVGGLPAHIAGMFREPFGFQQTASGTYVVFDRRGHAVYTVARDTVTKVVDIGPEPGRVLDPTAFDLNPADGTFVVADAPLRQSRVQIFNLTGGRLSGFTFPEREKPRVMFESVVLNGIASIQYTGVSLLINQPETGGLVSELGPYGTPIRSFGRLRATGQESDRDVHLALNAGLPLVDPTGGYYFVFVAGVPMFRKYDAKGTLLFERHVEGPEIDRYLESMPTTWTRRRDVDGDLLPVVNPAIRTAAVDSRGRLWIALIQPVSYVYDGSGEKIRTVEFRGAGILAPSSLFFTPDGRILATPGCYSFRAPL